jgi:hypothetical protein
VIGVYTTRPMAELRGRVVRRVYHLMLRDLAAPLIMTDDTKNTLVKRVRHITQDGAYYDAMSFARTTKEDWWSIQKRIGFRRSEHYDQVADMVRREFPALAPYVMIKRAKHVLVSGQLMIDDVVLLHMRKKFKLDAWHKR